MAHPAVGRQPAPGSAASSASTPATSRPTTRTSWSASGSGGDRPPINDTAIAFPITGGDNVQPLWISRCFDSVYSVAITEKAVYIGGHFSWNESPTANQPVARPRQRRLRHRPGPVGLRPRRPGGPPRPPRRARPRHRQRARVEPGLELLRGQQGHGGHLARPVRRRRRHRTKAACTPAGSRSSTSTPSRPEHHRHDDHRPRSRAASCRRHAVHHPGHGDDPAASGGCRSRSRTATPSATCRTT